MIKTVCIGLLSLFFISCNQASDKVETKSEIFVDKQTSIINYSGNYVTPDYIKRKEGYDWVAVSITKLSDSTIHVTVRSRTDIKKPTCTFDQDATKTSDSTYITTVNSKAILYTFRDNNLVISTKQKEDIEFLHYYCSGGGTLANTYVKINEPLDEK